MSDGEQDKKRNKLGYQRISIACAHCRRRKIRCLLADKDPQGRCQNCIRLKKECLFYPIEQQNGRDSRVGSTSSSAVSSTSPDIQAVHGVRHSQFPPFPQGTQNFQGMAMEPSMGYEGHYLPPQRHYSESLVSSSAWPPSTVSAGYDLRPLPHATSPGRPNDPGYWSYDQAEGSGDFAPFPNEGGQRVRTPSTTYNTAFPQSSPEQWQLQQPPTSARSMTYPLPAASNVTEYAPTYATHSPQQIPSVSYPPFSVPLESPQMASQTQGPPYSAPIPQTQFVEAPHERPEAHGAMPVQPGYWYGPGLGLSVHQQQASTPSHAPRSYVVPSQRPR